MNMNTDYNFEDKDCELIRNSKGTVFMDKNNLDKILNNRKDFVNKTKGFSGCDKCKIINELLIMIEQRIAYLDSIIEYLTGDVK